MDLPRYNVLPSDEFQVFSFWSVGPKGRIHKMIRYRLIQLHPLLIFNVGLADIDDQTGEIRDDVVSNNGDKDKILMTVVETLKIFFDHYPDAHILALGNSPSRNRLYQMMISKHLHQIPSRVTVFGFVKSRWELFRRNRNYTGFMVNMF